METSDIDERNLNNPEISYFVNRKSHKNGELD